MSVDVPVVDARWRRLAHAAAAVWLLAVAALYGVHTAPPTTWAHPLTLGPLTPTHHVVELRRTDTALLVGVEGPEGRRGVQIRRRTAVAGPPPLSFAGRYRVDASGPPLDRAALDALTATLAAWEAERVPPPPFLRAAGPTPSPRDRLEVALSHGAAALAAAGLVALLPEVLAVAGLSPAAWAAGGLVALLAAALVTGLGAAGAWHANEHAHDRISDLTFGTPAAFANLARVHGTGFYAVAAPLVGGGPDGGRDVHAVMLALSVLGLAPWLAALRVFLGDSGRALAASMTLVSLGAWLRLAGSEAMYVPTAVMLGLVALATELVLATGRTRWLAFGAPALLVVTHSRADLLALAPAAVVLRLLLDPRGGAAVLREPRVLSAIVAVGAAMTPRALTLLSAERPALTPRGPLGWDPRWLLAVGLVFVGLAASRADRRPGPTRAALLAAAAATVVASGRAAMVDLKPWGNDPFWQAHAGLDPRWTAPWTLALALVGVWRLTHQHPARGGFVLVALGGSVATLLPAYDCTSTYVAVAWPTLPLIAAAAASAARPPVVAALAAGGLLWSAGPASFVWPKAVQDRLLRALPEVLPPGAVVVTLRADDVLDAADLDAAAFHTASLDLARHLGDRFEVADLDAWRGGRLPPDRPVVFVESLACHRPVLSRRGPKTAVVGAAVVPYGLTGAPVVGPGPHVALPDGTPNTQPACVEALSAALGEVHRAPLPGVTQGSVWEEATGAGVHIGWWLLARRPASGDATLTPILEAP